MKACPRCGILLRKWLVKLSKRARGLINGQLMSRVSAKLTPYCIATSQVVTGSDPEPVRSRVNPLSRRRAGCLHAPTNTFGVGHQ